MSEVRRGACLCRAVEFSVELPTLFCVHCHCTMCQRNHGAAYVTWLGIARDNLTIDAGEAALVRHQSSEHGTRTFCGGCGTSLFCENDAHPDRVDIPLANMTEPIDREPQLRVFFDDRSHWTVIGDDLPRLGGETGMEPIDGND